MFNNSSKFKRYEKREGDKNPKKLNHVNKHNPESGRLYQNFVEIKKKKNEILKNIVFKTFIK